MINMKQNGKLNVNICHELIGDCEGIKKNNEIFMIYSLNVC